MGWNKELMPTIQKLFSYSRPSDVGYIAAHGTWWGGGGGRRYKYFLQLLSDVRMEQRYVCAQCNI
jgi:hypothetical protein